MPSWTKKELMNGIKQTQKLFLELEKKVSDDKGRYWSERKLSDLLKTEQSKIKNNVFQIEYDGE